MRQMWGYPISYDVQEKLPILNQNRNWHIVSVDSRKRKMENIIKKQEDAVWIYMKSDASVMDDAFTMKWQLCAKLDSASLDIFHIYS